MGMQTLKCTLSAQPQGSGISHTIQLETEWGLYLFIYLFIAAISALSFVGFKLVAIGVSLHDSCPGCVVQTVQSYF